MKRIADPYKKVWNAVEDEESTLVEWNANGTLFVPTCEELALRHMGHCRYLLRKAKAAGATNEGRAIFKDAMFHRNRASDLMNQHLDIVAKSR